MIYSVVTALSLMVGNGTPANQPGYQAPPQQQQPAQPQPGQQQPAQPQQPTTQAAPVPTDSAELAPVDLLFAVNSYGLPSESREKLEAVATWAKCNPRGAVILEGHADIRGTKEYNMTLSAERAGAVRERLIRLGVPRERIVVTVYGENGPRRGTLELDRRVTVRAAAKPIPKDDITAQR